MRTGRATSKAASRDSGKIDPAVFAALGKFCRAHLRRASPGHFSARPIK